MENEFGTIVVDGSNVIRSGRRPDIRNLAKLLKKLDKEEREYMVVKTRDGKLKEVWKTAALTEIFKKAEVGKLVAIKYLGERTGTTSGYRYYNYRAKISE